ncbi:MAG: hypothetical protein ACOYJG_00170 [Prevotella sp.]|jgi:hypothetical protein
MKAIGIRRDDVFSPNCIEKDRAILQSVLDVLTQEGWETELIDETEFSAVQKADFYFSMARDRRTLRELKQLEQEGRRVVNRAEGVHNCQRSILNDIMRRNHVPMAPEKGTVGWWLKRGDAAAQTRADVVFCPNDESLLEAKRKFLSRGITNFVVSAHVEGDLVKFYGVSNGFFRYFYPTDDGLSKFGDETKNGKAHHYTFNSQNLQADVERLARLTGVDVYGGDAIINEEGLYCIIDFNDWPSFSRCREDGAEAIAQLATKK